jgi:hypothetical protein
VAQTLVCDGEIFFRPIARTQTKVRATSFLISDYQPGAAVAAIYAKLRCESQLGARRAMKRVDVSAVRIIPEMIFDQNFDPDLSLRHAIIINDR